MGPIFGPERGLSAGEAAPGGTAGNTKSDGQAGQEEGLNFGIQFPRKPFSDKPRDLNPRSQSKRLLRAIVCEKAVGPRRYPKPSAAVELPARCRRVRRQVILDSGG